MAQMTIRPNSWRAWCLAIRPKTLTAALVPVLIGTTAAYADRKHQLSAALFCLLFAALMQVASNFINDLYDFLKGTDRADRLGPARACAQGWITPRAMRVGIGVVLALAAACGLFLLPYGGFTLLYIGVACVLFAFLYTTVFSYIGLGDLLVLVFFGLVPVVATYYVQTGVLTTPIWWLGMACGLSIDALLVVNNYRDRDTDRAVGKRTIVVMLGERWGERLYLFVGVGAALCVMVGTPASWPWSAIAMSGYLWLHFLNWRTLLRLHSGRALNAVLGKTSQTILLFGLLTAVILLL